MKELVKPGLFFHDSLWAYRSLIPWSAHGSYMKELRKPSLFFHDLLRAYRGAIPWYAHGSYCFSFNILK